MTINSAETRIQYAPTAGTVNFNVPFQFENDSDVKVYLKPAADPADPTSQILVLNVDYTIVGAGWGDDSVARTVTLVTGTTTGDIITIELDMPDERTTDFELSAALLPSDINDQFDSLVAMVKQNLTKLKQTGLYYVVNQELPTDYSQNIIPKLPDQSGDKIPIWSTNSSGTLIATELEEASSLSTLRADLANDINGSAGALLVGYYNASLSPANTTVNAALDHVVGMGPVSFGYIGQVISGFMSAPTGWLLMDDGTIGSATSGADHASADYEDLFTAIWNSCSNTVCPVSPGPRGASAAADWASNFTLQLPRINGRMIGASGTPAYSLTFTTDYAVSPTILTVASTSDFTSGMVIQVSSTTTLPAPLLASTNYVVDVISGTTLSLYGATTGPTVTAAQNYTASTNIITLTNNGSGTHTISIQFDGSKASGEFEGYHNHILTLNELTLHRHEQSKNSSGSSAGTQRDPLGPTAASQNTQPTGLSEAFSITQMSSYMPHYIKYQ